MRNASYTLHSSHCVITVRTCGLSLLSLPSRVMIRCRCTGRKGKSGGHTFCLVPEQRVDSFLASSSGRSVAAGVGSLTQNIRKISQIGLHLHCGPWQQHDFQTAGSRNFIDQSFIATGKLGGCPQPHLV